MTWVACIILLLGTAGLDRFQSDGFWHFLQIDSQEKPLEDPAVVGIADMIPNIHLEVPPFQAMGTVPEAPLEDLWIPEELCYGAAGEDQPFLDPLGKAKILFLFLDFSLESSGAPQGWGWLETLNNG